MRHPMKYINGPMGFFAPCDTYVRWDDYAYLAAEVERLKAEVEWLRKADRLVCWNEAAQEWQVRHEAPK